MYIDFEPGDHVINPANRVDAIENFDVGLNYDTRTNQSKFFQVSNTKLTNKFTTSLGVK